MYTNFILNLINTLHLYITYSSWCSIMKMKKLTAFLGTTPETLYRKLKLLEKEGFIKRDKKTIIILDHNKLENI
ncbi:helix-turn-helix domain-containing protein [Clostridium algidicarnis]|nr:helix-turn-helix domain-containing protein [Clostridium algidicarnis]MBU3197599.1 helix-turn-helix domain-containing protein [Clostridium algidicarnis]